MYDYSDELNYYYDELNKVTVSLEKVIALISRCEEDLNNDKKEREKYLDNKDKTVLLLEEEKEKAKLFFAYESIQKTVTLGYEDNKFNVVQSAQELIDETFKNEIEALCRDITKRLSAWGLQKYNDATFDYGICDFKFSGTPRKMLGKGYKSLCTSAMLIQLILHTRVVGINFFDFIMLDSLWTSIYSEGISFHELVSNIKMNLKEENIQTIIFENEPYLDNDSSINYISNN